MYFIKSAFCEGEMCEEGERGGREGEMVRKRRGGKEGEGERGGEKGGCIECEVTGRVGEREKGREIQQ